jgi:hypothetical protein
MSPVHSRGVKMESHDEKPEVRDQIAFFKTDGSIEVIEHPGPEEMNINAFNREFAKRLENCFWLIVNLRVAVYSYKVENGKVKL